MKNKMNLQEFSENIRDNNADMNVKRDIGFQIGKVLEEARTIKGMTQVKLAEMIGTTQPVIARIENGNRLPTFNFLNRIALAFESYLIPPKFGFMENNEVKIETSITYDTNKKDSQFSGEIASRKYEDNYCLTPNLDLKILAFTN